jgi:hypothetical protein
MPYKGLISVMCGMLKVNNYILGPRSAQAQTMRLVYIRVSNSSRVTSFLTWGQRPILSLQGIFFFFKADLLL